MIYKNKFGKVNILEDAESFDNQVIGLSMSGGADSLLLCYLIANTISKLHLNTAIQPFNGYDISVPYDSYCLIKVIPILREKFPEVEIKWPISTVYETYGKDIKMEEYIVPLRNLLQSNFVFTKLITGVSLGPPVKVQEQFSIPLSSRKIRRIPGYFAHDELEWDTWPISTTPFKNIDKRFIIQCYKDLDILDLFDITASCTESENDGSPCNKCWWCYERNWAKKEVLGE